MISKEKLRKKFFDLRKKKYKELNSEHFSVLIKYIKNKYKKKKKILLALYYPSNCELNVLQIFNNGRFDNFITLLPVIEKKQKMKFVKWGKNDLMKLNQYGIPEPLNTKHNLKPDVILIPLLSFDKFKNRLGYGKGYYDRFLGKFIRLNHKIETIGIAFSFQKYRKLPIKKHDISLNKIFTEKGFIK